MWTPPALEVCLPTWLFYIKYYELTCDWQNFNLATGIVVVNFGSGTNSAIRDAVLRTEWWDKVSRRLGFANFKVSYCNGWCLDDRQADTIIEALWWEAHKNHNIALDWCVNTYTIHICARTHIQIQTHTHSHTFSLCNIRLVCAGWQAGIEARSPGLAHGPSVKSWSAQLTWKPDLHIFSTTWRRISIGSISFVKKDR